jgi:hypothetical protein
MDELKNYTLDKLYKRLFFSSDDEFVIWLQGLGLLHRTRTCICGSKMRQRAPTGKKKYGNWQCPERRCRKERGFLADTWFEHTKISLKEVCLFIDLPIITHPFSISSWRISGVDE